MTDESLFFQSLDVPAEEREAWLASASEDERQRARVRALLAAHSRPGSFLANPVGNPARTCAAEAGRPKDLPQPGEQLGPYTLLEVIGEGGMGVVYAARQEEPVRRLVAIKLIKRGMDTEEIVRRFLRERRILAGLSHPNIARLLDGGATEDGRPYFILEHVKGKPITTWAR